jgi:hypothetical protein
MFYRPDNKLHGGPELLAFYLFLWALISVVSPIIYLLKTFRVIKGRLQFTLTLLVLFNLYVGAYGSYMIVSKQIAHPGALILFFLLNLLWALLLIIMAVREDHRS